MQSLRVELGERSYPIHVGAGLINHLPQYLPPMKGRQVVVITNETLAPLYLDSLLQGLREYQVSSVILPDGESFKSLTTLDSIFTQLLERRLSRTVTLIALGGGVVGDITGFAAATYQRGVNFIQIPTTLLAQVDSSVGGKTAVNHPLGKNMIGAFHQPQLVLADTTTLKTLPQRELSAGLAEVIKYGLIRDESFLTWLEHNMDALLAGDEAALQHAILRSCEVKAEVVAADEREGGVRAILNFGHTFGHAIEAAQGYGQWLHGEAVAAGMVMAADLSWREGLISETDVERVRTIIASAQLPVTGPADMSVELYLDKMAVDKKNLDSKLRLVLLNSIGNAIVTSKFDSTNLRTTLDECTS